MMKVKLALLFLLTGGLFPSCSQKSSQKSMAFDTRAPLFNMKISPPFERVKLYRKNIFRQGAVVHAIYYDTANIRDYLVKFDKMMLEFKELEKIEKLPDGYGWKIGFVPMKKIDENGHKYLDFCVVPLLVSRNELNRSGYPKAIDIFDTTLSLSKNIFYRKILEESMKLTAGPTGVYDYGQKDP